ncbi:hypothetical protein [Pontibacter beigongshangensis]|uniref:hypothetical protein n=1 Tax=Pontibacter beigongshangensis TaxID=2574733 RepID=UPI00164F8EC8|nr:hypothetical protein [Pontibacter beigongshangensis]
MGIHRTQINSVGTMVLTMLLCLVICIALPPQTQASSLPEKDLLELRQKEQAPITIALQESGKKSARHVAQNDRLLLARLTSFKLCIGSLPYYSHITPLPAVPVFKRVSPSSPIQSKGP